MINGGCCTRRIGGLLLLVVGIVSGTLGGGLIATLPASVSTNPVPWFALALCSTIMIMLGAHWLGKACDDVGTR